MLIIGHRGASGLAHENTLEALAAGKEAGCDILHIDVRLTRDGVPVLCHDPTLKRTHDIDKSISQLRLTELEALTQDKPVPTLESILDRYFGRILLLVELRSRGSAQRVIELLTARCGSSKKRWNNVVLASYKPSDLLLLRKHSAEVPLALLHDNNPFTYIAYQRTLDLTAAGFHRLHTNRLAHEIAKKAGIFTFTYTVNRPDAAKRMENQGYDGVITSYPDRLTGHKKRRGADS